VFPLYTITVPGGPRCSPLYPLAAGMPCVLQVLDGLLIPVTSRPTPKAWRLRSRFLRLGGLQRLVELIAPRGLPGVTQRARRACYLCCLHILRLYLAPGHDPAEPGPEGTRRKGRTQRRRGRGLLGPGPERGRGGGTAPQARAQPRACRLRQWGLGLGRGARGEAGPAERRWARRWRHGR